MTPPATSGWHRIAQRYSFWAKFWSRFLDSLSTDSENVRSFGSRGSRVICSCVGFYTFLLLDPENEAQVDLPSFTRYANGWPHFQRGT